jgi:hypothetical protein
VWFVVCLSVELERERERGDLPGTIFLSSQRYIVSRCLKAIFCVLLRSLKDEILASKLGIQTKEVAKNAQVLVSDRILSM